MEILVVFIIMIVLLIGFAFGLYKYKNLRPKPEYFEYYKTQGKVPEGKVGVFATALFMTEDHSHEMFHNVTYKVFNQVVPWPFRKLALRDIGIALLDPAHTHARKEFTPTHLEDAFGNDKDCDGFPWMEKYKRGERDAKVGSLPLLARWPITQGSTTMAAALFRRNHLTGKAALR